MSVEHLTIREIAAGTRGVHVGVYGPQAIRSRETQLLANSRTLTQDIPLTADLSPLDTFRAFEDENGRVYVTWISGPDSDDDETPVIVKIWRSITTALKGAAVASGEGGEAIAEAVKRG